MTGRHQLGVCALAIVAAALNLVPIDLQRRMVDGPITAGDLDGLIRLGLIYLGVVLLHRALRLVLLLWQSWLSESAILYVRGHLTDIHRARDPANRRPGEAVSVVTAEIDRLGGFAGQAPSQAAANVALMAGMLGYMLWMSPAIAALSVALVAPQIALMPVIQRRLNRLVDEHLDDVRALGEDLGTEAGAPADGRLESIYDNRIAFSFWKSLMKTLINTLNLLAPLAVLGWGGWLVIQGQTTIGVLVAFLSGFDRLAAPVRELLTFYRNAQQAAVQHASIARWMS